MHRWMISMPMTPEELRIQAVVNYVVYRTINQARRKHFATGEKATKYISQYMDQQVHEATRDHPALRKCCHERIASRGLKRRRDKVM